MEYPEGIVPRGGLLVTIGVDVQHDRLAVIVRARESADLDDSTTENRISAKTWGNSR